MHTGSQQKGLSLISIMVIVGVVGTALLIGLRLIPIYSDYMTIVSIAKDVQQDIGEIGANKTKIRERLSAQFRTNNIRSVGIDSVKIDYDKQRNIVLVVKYEDRRPIIANLDVVAKFERRLGGLN